MSHCCDGADSVPDKVSVFVEGRPKRAYKKVKENTSFEAAFKGFEKKTSVLVERYDITPYLKTKNNIVSKPGRPCIKYEKYEKLNPFLVKCSVNVLRDDLEKLKESFLKNPEKFTAPMVDQGMNMVTIKCKICEKIYTSHKRLQKHEEKKHMIVYKPQNSKPQKRVSFSDKVIIHEVKEYHKCRKCTKIFENYRSLKVHMKLRHKKRKCYICSYCLKKFVDRMFFKVHIKLHCDVCGSLFDKRSDLILHRRESCRTIKIYKCKTCEENFFKFMDLKDHCVEHVKTCYICDICKDQFQTKCAVAHHISFLHSNRRPLSLYDMRNLGSERLYLCRFCEESSVDRNLIESHVQLLPDLTNRAMTGYKDYYFCDQCMKKFGTEHDMLKHKWSHFLKTSDNSQVRPNSILANDKKEIIKKFRLDEKLPDHIKQPRVVVEKIKVAANIPTEPIAFVNVESFDVSQGEIKKMVVQPKPKKTTIFSKHQCLNCDKYFSSNSCLQRHRETQHNDYENLRCKMCEETFVWPSLLQSHKCIRLNIPEMPFKDARPEIHFDNLHEIATNGFDDLNITETEDYRVDFEIPTPVCVNEVSSSFVPNVSGMNGHQLTQMVSGDKTCLSPLQSLGYKIVMQEVPIEF